MKKLLIVALLNVFLVVLVLQATPTNANPSYAGHKPVLALAEILTSPDSGEAGRTVWLRKDLGNKQLDHDFVYGDPRRALFNGGKAGITFAVDTGNQSADVNLTNQIGWMYQSIQVWNAETCSDLTLSENAVVPGSTGYVAALFGYGNATGWYADLTQVGFDSAFFNIPLLGPNVLGVTFTLFWVDGADNFTDIDNNGKFDVAFREIYYNDNFNWSDNGNLGVPGARIFDLPTVAIHEVGHGFSQAHFGNIGRKNGALVAAPDAVMNAIYGGVKRELYGTDRGGHCSNWASWPIK